MRLRADNFGTAMLSSGICFQCIEVQFHSPAEHLKNGRTYDMEVQILCKATTDGFIGKKLMIAVWAEFKPD